MTQSETNEPTITVHEEIQRINESLDAFLCDGDLLPEAEVVSWRVVKGQAIIENGRVRKTSQASEYESIVLEVTFADQSTATFDHLLLLDPYVAYVISYFSENGDEKETMKLAFTYDGTYWFKLNDDHCVLKPEIGTQRMRDPFIMRNANGTFTVLATQGYDTDSIYAYHSQDLLSFEQERLLNVNITNTALNLSGKQAWAPEGFYDRINDSYVITWSSVEDHGMFYNTTSDFLTVSEPYVLYQPGFDVIDGTIVKMEDHYCMVVKNEEPPMETDSRLFTVFSGQGYDHFESVGITFTGPQSEGPMVMKNLYKDGYTIVYDDYTRFAFKAVETKDFRSFSFLDDRQLMIPLTDPAHCSAIAVTWKELERLELYYNEKN